MKYPDGSTSGADNVQYIYHTDGTLNTRTDQRGIILTFQYDELRRPARQEATASGGVASKGVDPAVLAIARTYDTLGRVTNVTSYNAATGGTAVNEVKYTYLCPSQLARTVF